MKIEYVPFREEMIPEAGELLAGRHRCNPESLTLLPQRFEEPQNFLASRFWPRFGFKDVAYRVAKKSTR